MCLVYSELNYLLSYTWPDMSVISVALLHIRLIRNKSDLLTYKLTVKCEIDFDSLLCFSKGYYH